MPRTRTRLPRGFAARRMYSKQGAPRPVRMRAAIARTFQVGQKLVAPLLPPTPIIDLIRAHWLDISYWQWSFNPPQTTPYPIDGIFQRVLWGLTKDGRLLELRDDISQADIKAVCSYQYVRTIEPMMAQAEAHLMTREGMDYDGSMQDWEEYGNNWTPQNVREAYEAYMLIKQVTEQPTYVYLNPAFYNTHIVGTLTELEIQTINFHWAQWYYNPDPNKWPNIPRDWGVLEPWQYIATMSGDAYGVESAYVDGDVFKETTEQVWAHFKVGPPPPVPTECPNDAKVKELDRKVFEITSSIVTINDRIAQNAAAIATLDKRVTDLEDDAPDPPDPPPGEEEFWVLEVTGGPKQKENGRHRVYRDIPHPAIHEEFNLPLPEGGTIGVYFYNGAVVQLHPVTPFLTGGNVDGDTSWYRMRIVKTDEDGKVLDPAVVKGRYYWGGKRHGLPDEHAYDDETGEPRYFTAPVSHIALTKYVTT